MNDNKTKQISAPTTSITEMLYECATKLDSTNLQYALFMTAAQNPRCDPQTLQRLIDNTSLRDERYHISANPNLTEEQFSSLIKNRGTQNLQGLAKNPNKPGWLIKKLVAWEHIPIYRELARDPQCEPTLLHQLLRCSDQRVCVVAAQNPNIGSEYFKKPLKNHPQPVLAALYANPVCPQNITASVAKGNNLALLEGVAQNPSLDPETFKTLVEKDNYDIYEALLKNPECPPWIIQYLVEEKAGRDLLSLAAAHKNTPVELLERLLGIVAGYVAIIAAANPNLSEQHIVNIIQNSAFYSYDYYVKAGFLKNPNCPTDLLIETLTSGTQNMDSWRERNLVENLINKIEQQPTLKNLQLLVESLGRKNKHDDISKILATLLTYTATSILTSPERTSAQLVAVQKLVQDAGTNIDVPLEKSPATTIKTKPAQTTIQIR